MNYKTMLTVLAVALAFPTVASADDAELESAKEKFAGEFQAEADRATERERIDVAIERVVSEMSRVRRRFARSSLEDSTTPCETFKIRFSSDVMQIHCTTNEPARTHINGPRVRWTNNEGEEFALEQKLEANRMTQRFESEDGARINEYTLREGGDVLVKSVTITSDRLPKDLTYSRTFRRQ